MELKNRQIPKGASPIIPGKNPIIYRTATWTVVLVAFLVGWQRPFAPIAQAPAITPQATTVRNLSDQYIQNDAKYADNQKISHPRTVNVTIGDKCRIAINSVNRDALASGNSQGFNPQKALRWVDGCDTERTAQDETSER
jgi:hypothetical protein